MNAQIIEKNSKPEWAVVPYEDYLRLIEAKEMLDDIVAFDSAVSDPDTETVPHAVVKQLVAGKNPVRVWRDHRRLTQRELASRAGISKAYLSQIEGGGWRAGSTKVVAGLADALGVAVEDLLGDQHA